MKKVLITGTSKGIGHRLALDLLERGYYVFGISRTASNIRHKDYDEFLMDLCDTDKLCTLWDTRLRDIGFDILINNAGVGFYGPHSTLNADKIREMVTVNLEVPMLLSNLLLPSVIAKHGAIINISSVTAKQNNNTHGVAYGATKAGLSSFSNSLFAEIRKHQVRVICIHPEMTDTELYRNADFEASQETGCSLTPKQVSDAVIYGIEAPEGICINDITLTPQFNRIARKNK